MSQGGVIGRYGYLGIWLLVTKPVRSNPQTTHLIHSLRNDSTGLAKAARTL